jgi:YD repeat-containing protein
MKTIMTAMLMMLALPASSTAQSQRTFYDTSGRVSGREVTSSNGSTTIYDANGRVTGRTSTGRRYGTGVAGGLPFSTMSVARNFNGAAPPLMAT